MISSRAEEELKKHSRIGLAVSGGMDSMAMLHYMYYNDYDIIVVNVEHGIRGENSLSDSEFVRSYCENLSIPCKVFHVDSIDYAKSNGYTLEQSARILRHDILREFGAKHGIPIATAHHASDQAESVFMHIARGSGINGLTGMGVCDGHLLRPLIDTLKSDIEQYVSLHEIPYVSDETNDDDSYTRNYVRKVIFPVIEERYPGFVNNLCKLSVRASEIVGLIDGLTPEFAHDNGAVTFDNGIGNKTVKANAIFKACAALGVKTDIEERHIDMIESLKNNKSADLPHGLTAYLENDKIAIEIKSEKDMNEYPLCDGVFSFGYGSLEARISDKALDGYKQIDVSNGGVMRVRTRRDADRIRLSYGGKNVSDVLNDHDVPLRLKDKVPLIVNGDDIVAVGDIEVSPGYRTAANSRKIMNIKWIR